MLEWALAFVLVVFVRLPYLLGDHVFFDGDEAIVGIMACDLLSMEGLPFYFYGQQYGFSFFEALSAAIFTLFLGPGPEALKCGGMLLFSLGLQRIMRIFRWSGFTFWSYVLCTLGVAMFPTWIVWGTMLRGGYLTAFVGLCFITEHLLIYPTWQRKHWLAVGLSTAVVTVSHVFFLIVLLPLLVHRLRSLPRNWIVPVFGWSLCALVLLRIPAYLNVELWVPVGMGSVHPQNLLNFFLADFWSYFCGFFLFDGPIAVPLAIRLSSIFFVALMVCLLVFVLARTNADERRSVLLMLLGTILAALPVTLFELGGGRYLLGFFSGMMLIMVWLAVISRRVLPGRHTLLASVAVGALVPAMLSYRHYVNMLIHPELNDMVALRELQDAIDDDIRHAVVLDWQLLWQLNYLSEGRSSFRSQYNLDRMDRFYERVNHCYLDSDCRVGLVGTHWSLSNLTSDRAVLDSTIQVNGRYFIVRNPDWSLLNEHVVLP